jgi:hypothetical protein
VNRGKEVARGEKSGAMKAVCFFLFLVLAAGCHTGNTAPHPTDSDRTQLNDTPVVKKDSGQTIADSNRTGMQNTLPHGNH